MSNGTKVLVIDDNEDFTKMTTSWLRSKGYEHITASDGSTGVRLVKEENPDIVILDLRMPGMDGIETLKEIRSFNKEVPVIVISAYVNDPSTYKILSYGISGVFYKGQDFEEMSPLLESALRLSKRRTEGKK